MSVDARKEAMEALAKMAKDEVAQGLKSFEESNAQLRAQLEEQGLLVKSLQASNLEMVQGLAEENKKREKTQQGFSYLKAIKGQRTGNWADAGYEKDIHDEMVKANATNPDAAGGYIVPTELWMPEFRKTMAEKSIIDSIGVRTISLVGRGDIEIPAADGDLSATWVGEAVTTPLSDYTLDAPLTLKPKTIVGGTKYSKKVLNQTGGQIDTLIRENLMRSLVLKLQNTIFYGTGVSPVPMGLTASVDPANIIHDVAGTAISLESLMEMIGLVEDGNFAVDNAKFVSSPAFLRKLKLLKDTSGTPLFAPESSADPLDYYFGYKSVTTNGIYSKKTDVALTGGSFGDVFFGDFSNILIGMWQGLSIESSDVADDVYYKNQIAIKASGEFDVGNLRPAAFAYTQNMIVR